MILPSQAIQRDTLEFASGNQIEPTKQAKQGLQTDKHLYGTLDESDANSKGKLGEH